MNLFLALLLIAAQPEDRKPFVWPPEPATAVTVSTIEAAEWSGGDWCVNCRKLRPVLDRLRADGYVIRSSNADEHPDEATAWGITALPTTVIYRIRGGDRYEITRIVGYYDYESMRAMFLKSYPLPIKSHKK